MGKNTECIFDHFYFLFSDPKDGYDQKTCCSRAGVKDDCMPMCQYNASLSEVRKLTNLCKDDLVKTTKCAAGEFKGFQFMHRGTFHPKFSHKLQIPY